MYKAEILCDSVTGNDTRLTTFEITYPRMVLAEFNTHRVFSRNTASSRAIPIAKMIETVRESICPIQFWGKNQAGMQADERLQDSDKRVAENIWEEAKTNAIYSATQLMSVGAHKQIVNRLLEPFMWITTVVSATEFGNFFELRCHPAAQPEIKHIAEMMRELYNNAEPVDCEQHLPYIAPEEYDEHSYRVLRRISAARCARVSYRSNKTMRPSTIEEDEELCDRLLEQGHLSPFEHVARAATASDNYEKSNFHKDWIQYRKELECPF